MAIPKIKDFSLVNHTPEELANVTKPKRICFVMKNRMVVTGYIQFYSPEEIRIKTFPANADKYIRGDKLYGWYYA